MLGRCPASSRRFQTIADTLATLPANDLILDGEAVVADSRGIPISGCCTPISPRAAGTGCSTTRSTCSIWTADDLKRELAAGRVAAPPDPRAGAFGPDSIMWRIDREALLFFGAGRAALLQLAHSCGRGHRRPLPCALRPDRPSPTHLRDHLRPGLRHARPSVRSDRRLHQLHGAIQGILPLAAGPFAGSQYHANDVGALRWVHATLVETSLALYETAGA